MSGYYKALSNRKVTKKTNMMKSQTYSYPLILLSSYPLILLSYPTLASCVKYKMRIMQKMQGLILTFARLQGKYLFLTLNFCG